MAKNFTPKGNKVTGTNKKDKIFWQSSSAWQKPLIVHGKNGNDKIVFLKSYFNKNKLYGDAGNDTIIGSLKNDYIYGGAGNDIITGNSGNDQIHCNAGWDLVDGGGGKDKIWCDSGANAVTGGKDNDTIYGGTGYDAIAGASGDDVIKLKAFSDSAQTITFHLNSTLSKVFGKSEITLTEKLRSFVSGGAGNDKIYNIRGGAMVFGEGGKDTITAEAGENTIHGGSSADSITASGGNNHIYGEGGNDIIKINGGNNWVDGGSSADTITATAGNNTLYGGTNDDSITGGSGDDYIEGGAGNDIIKAGGGNNIIHYNKNDGYDTIISGGGTDTLELKDYNSNSFKKGSYSGNDLILKDNGVNITLKDFKSGNHSVKYVMFGNDSTAHDISEYVPDAYLNSAPKLMSTPNGNALKAEVAAWQSNDNSGYADVSDSFTGAKEENIIAVVANNYTNQPY